MKIRYLPRVRSITSRKVAPIQLLKFMSACVSPALTLDTYCWDETRDGIVGELAEPLL